MKIWRSRLCEPLLYFQTTGKERDIMIKIDKDTATLVRKALPWIHVKRTVHHYYMEENPKAMGFLRRQQRIKTKH